MAQHLIMFVAFFESIKYVGHLFPMAILRIYMGYFYFQRALDRLSGEFLTQPRLVGSIEEWLPHSNAPGWYIEILEGIVQPNWKIFAYLITYCEFLIGISFIVGFFVRPISILAIFIGINFIYASGSGEMAVNEIFVVLFIIMGWLGAGRCLGFDYFFFKRQRGLWW